MARRLPFAFDDRGHDIGNCAQEHYRPDPTPGPSEAIWIEQAEKHQHAGDFHTNQRRNGDNIMLLDQEWHRGHEENQDRRQSPEEESAFGTSCWWYSVHGSLDRGLVAAKNSLTAAP